MTKERRRYQRTSAAGISQYLRRRGVPADRASSAVMGGRWVITVNFADLAQANAGWVALWVGGYNLIGQFHEWIVVAEKQDDGEGIM